MTTRRPLHFVVVLTLACLAAVVIAALADVRDLWSGWFSSSVPLVLSDAKLSQCSLSGVVLAPTGNDPKLVWDGLAAENVRIDVEVESSETDSLEVFWGTPEQPRFSPDRCIAQTMFPGKNRISIPIPGKIRGLRLDFGHCPGETFRVRSAILSRGPWLCRPWSWHAFFLRAAFWAPLVFLAGLHFYLPANRIWSVIDKYRFVLAAGLLAFAVIFKLHGSSVGMWNRLVPHARAEPPLFGVERPIRSDEWAVFTPMTLAQASAKPAWPYFNDIPRAVPTDMYSVYAQPVRHPLLVFRPFLAGHVLFGFERGLAFFWFGRWLALLLLMYELFKFLTNGFKPLAAIASLLVVLSPVVQWWGAINALAEMLVFGSIFVLCLNRFMVGSGLRDRWLPVLGMGYSGVCYAMTLYPAAMVPLAYVFGALCLWIVIRRAKGFRLDYRSLVFSLAVAAAAAGCLAWYLHLSADSFRIVSGTEYPGKRFDCGGGFRKGLGLSLGGLFFPWTSGAVEDGNVFNRAMFPDFFPLGIGLCAFGIFLRKIRDNLVILLLAVSAVFGAYCFFGLPPWLAKLSLLFRSTAPRAFVALSFVQFLLVVRCVALIRPTPSLRMSAVSALVFSCVAAFLAHLVYPNYLTPPRLLLVWFVGFSGGFLFLRFRVRQFAACVFFAALAVALGAFANPVQRGDAGIADSELARTIRGIVEKDGGVWLVEGESFPMNQYPLLIGAPTINAGNLYPALERWRELDPEGTAEETWNRYATGIRFDVKPGVPMSIIQTWGDTFRIECSPDVLNSLGVRHILSRNGPERFSSDGLRADLEARAAEWNVYRIAEGASFTGQALP